MSALSFEQAKREQEEEKMRARAHSGEGNDFGAPAMLCPPGEQAEMTARGIWEATNTALQASGMEAFGPGMKEKIATALRGVFAHRETPMIEEIVRLKVINAELLAKLRHSIAKAENNGTAARETANQVEGGRRVQ